MRLHPIPFAVTALAATGLATILGAQGSLPVAVDGPARTGLCFRGRPLPHCGSFLITEFGVAYRMNGHPSRSSAAANDEALITWELGAMVNLNSSYAVGGSVSAGSLGFDNGSRWAVRPRLRRWVGQGGALEVEAGVLLGRTSGPNIQSKFPGFTGRIGFSAGDFVALTGGVDVLRFACVPTLQCDRRTGTDVAWYGGIKFASYLGVIVGVAVPIAVGVAGYSIQL